MVRIACTAFGIAYSVLRLQNVFGEGQSLNNPYTGILSILSTRIRHGLPLPIFEDGQETRDFVHVEDVARAVVACVEQPQAAGSTLNVGRGQPATVMDVARLLCELMGSRVEPHVTGEYRVGDIRHNHADISRLSSQLGLVPQVSLHEGMRRFCAWVESEPVPQDLLDKANSELRARKLMG
jgi:dTDP-L-rhamnose 4-epimerase